MTIYNKILIQYLEDIMEYEKKETDITINPSISQYGVSTNVNNIKEVEIDREK